MKKLLGYLVLLAILLVLVSFIIVYAPRVPSLGGQQAEDTSVQVQVARTYDDSDTYHIEAQYPQFGIAAIDARIKQVVDDAIAEFKAIPASPPDSALPQNEFTGTFDKVYVGPDYVSAELIVSEYTGGAHPGTVLIGMNFDRKTGTELTLEDALALAGKSLEEIASSSTAQLHAKLGLSGQGDAWFSEGATATPENYQTFLVSADAVTFVFQEYQVAPYAAGPQLVSFSRVR